MPNSASALTLLVDGLGAAPAWILIPNFKKHFFPDLQPQGVTDMLFHVLAQAQIRTKRLVLRPFAESDTDALHALWTLPEVRQFLWDDIVIERSLAAEVVEASIASLAAGSYGFYALFERPFDPGRSELIGFAGLRDYEDVRCAGVKRPEVLYGLAPACWGRGFAFEAAAAVLRFGFEHCALHRIDGGVDPPNERSRRVLERLGFANWRRLEIDGLPADYAELSREDFLGSDAAAQPYEYVPAEN